LNKDRWRDELRIWLESFSWQWFCSLTFRPGLNRFDAQRRLRRWADELRRELGNEQFEWVGIPESGRTGLNFHYHCLVGGLRDWRAGARLFWMRRWNKVAGDALIAKFNPDAGGISYILKNVHPNDVDDLELHLNSQSGTQTKWGTK
jgi:hypothetical protein